MEYQTKDVVEQRNAKKVSYYGIVIILVVLMVQSAVSLFIPMEITTSVQQIDIVFRTTLSSVFGFLISQVSMSQVKKEQSTETKPTNELKVQQAWDLPKEVPEKEEEKDLEAFEKLIRSPKLKRQRSGAKLDMQVMILLGVALFCLVIMIVVRNFSHMVYSPSTAALTIAQYRDFIASSLGALIGISREG